jgi:hypothetical protein
MNPQGCESGEAGWRSLSHNATFEEELRIFVDGAIAPGMNRTEFLQRLVLNTICDDFENVDQVILPEVAEQGAKCGLTFSRSDVVEALRGLVEAGLAKAYHLSASSTDPFSGQLAGMPPLDVVETDFRTYFYITKEGVEFHEADRAWWPFDDEESLRPDWNTPEP